MGASTASHVSKNVSTQQPSENSIIQVYVTSMDGKLQHCWSDATGGSTIYDLRERLRTIGHVHCKGRRVADSETLGSLRPTLVEKPNGEKVFNLSLAIDGLDLAPAPVPAPAPAPTLASLAEEAKAKEENWLESKSARVLAIDIQRHDDIESIHVSCQTLSGEEAMSSDFSAKATLAELESEMKSALKWDQLEFLSENGGKVNVSEPLKAYSTLNAKEVPFSSFSTYGIDEEKCRRCGGEYISVQRTVEWCQMNGDAGGKLNSFCKTCGLQLSKSWSDD